MVVNTNEKLNTGCLCEHISHLEDCLTPNGNPSHRFGQDFRKTHIVDVKTLYGITPMCLDCRDDCYAAFASKKGESSNG